MTLASQITALAVRIAKEVKPFSRTVKMDEGRALRTFRGAYLGGSSTTPTDILIMGASFEEGYGTTAMNNGWTNVFRDVLRIYAQTKGIAGGGALPASLTAAGLQAGIGNYYGFSPFGMYTGGAPGTYPDSPLVSAAGTFTALANIGLALRGLLANSLGATATVEFFGTGCDLIYTTQATGGAFSWAIDGGSTTIVSTAATASNGNRVAIRGLSRGRHTFTFTVTTLASGVAMEGLAFYDGDESAGIRVWQAGKASAKAQDLVTTTTWVNSLQTWNFPDLCVINLSGNDWTNGRTSAQIKADLLDIIARVKARGTTLGAVTPSFVLMSTFSVVPTGSTNVEPWQNVVDKIYEIASADDDVCVFDMQPWFGKDTETAVSTRGGILVADGVHPTDGGSAIIGGAMAEFVLGSSERLRDVRRFGNTNADPTYNASLTAQGPGFAADTYLAGSNVVLPTGRIKPGSMYRCKFKATKTAAGIASPIIQVRIGAAGAIADTSRATLTFQAQTGTTDDGFIEVFVTFRSVGSGTAAVIQASGVIDHRLAATGFSVSNTAMAEATSSGFDSTTANTYIGISVNGGSLAAWTVSQVQAELQNLA